MSHLLTLSMHPRQTGVSLMCRVLLFPRLYGLAGPREGQRSAQAPDAVFKEHTDERV
jgi:hypothetical protein